MKRCHPARYALSFVLTGLLILAPALNAQENTGNLFRSLSTEQQTAYVAGFAAGLVQAILVVEAEEPDLRLEASDLTAWQLLDCVGSWTGIQSHAVVDRWLDEHPERWHEHSNLLILEALMEACDEGG